MAVKFKCLCCGFEQSFADGEEAYRAGWDVPPYFTLQPFCDLCPSSPVALWGLEVARDRHRHTHEEWARDGRPEDFAWEEETKLSEQVREKIKNAS